MTLIEELNQCRADIMAADGGKESPQCWLLRRAAAQLAKHEGRIDGLETSLKSASVVIAQQLKAADSFANIGRQALAEIDQALSVP